MKDSNHGLTRLHVHELRIGMCVCRLETLNNQSPFIFDRLDIKTQADIQAIQAVCDYVFIDANWQKKFTGAIPTNRSSTSSQLSFARAFKQTANTFQETSNLVKTVLDDIRFGNQLNTESVKQAVSNCVNAILENADAMTLLTQLKDKDLYTSQHSMNVSILSILVGRELKLSLEELNNLGLCGLMHDIGKAKIPLDILNKPGKFEPHELKIMNKHATLGRDILISARNMYPGAVDTAYTHHEMLDGRGYPRGIDKSGLTRFTKIVSIVDAYDAITSDRCYQKGKPHLLALGVLVKGMNSQFDAGYVTKFINCIGFYPQGNLCEMSSGEIGIIVEQNKTDKLKPKVLLILNARKQKISEKIVDLVHDSKDEQGNSYKIRQIMRAQDYDVDLNHYLEQGLLTKKHPVA